MDNLTKEEVKLGARLFFLPWNYFKLARVIKEIYLSQTPIKKPSMIIMTGLSRSGKSTYVKKNYGGYFILETNQIHEIINQRFSFLRDDNTISGKAYWQRQLLTEIIRDQLIEKILAKGYALVVDGVNGSESRRQELLIEAEYFGYDAKIVYIKRVDWIDFYSELLSADLDLILNNKQPAWFDLVNKQSESFVEPTGDNVEVVEISTIDEI